MMCLGWANRYNCAARVPLELTATGGTIVGTAGTAAGSAAASASGCGTSMWFWIAGAAIVVGGMFKGHKK